MSKHLDAVAFEPDVALAADPGSRLRAGRKPHIVIVGHMAGSEFYGAERSLLSLLAAIDRSRYEVSCVLPEAREEYLEFSRPPYAVDPLDAESVMQARARGVSCRTGSRSPKCS